MFPNETPQPEHPPLSKLQGPETLAQLFNGRRHEQNKMFGNRLPQITDGDIEHLIKLCYYASTVTEEGRFPHFRLFLPIYNQSESIVPDIISLNPSIPLNDVKDIHRLAPAVSSLDYALRIIKVENELHCDALILVNDSEVLATIGKVFDNTSLQGIMMRVDSPGNILISETGFGVFNSRLRAGVVEGGQSFNQIELINNWLDFVSRFLANHFIADELAKSKNPGFPSFAKFDIEKILQNTWGRVLRKAIDAKHGGAFLILPQIIGNTTREKIKNEYKIDLKFPINNLNLSSDVINFWKSCDNDFVKEIGVPQFNPQDWYKQKHFLEAKIEGLANLANIDGCVVLDALLNVLGFGAEILISGEEAEKSNLTFAEYHPFPSPEYRKPIDEQEIKQFGTRNRSAFRFCKVYSGAIAFIISQDGDLRVFASDATNVFLLKNITTWTSIREAT
jgi:hypothetical protein